MSKITGVLIADGKAIETEVESSLDAYYKLLDCDCIDIVTRKIGGRYYDIICDDEGMFKENPAVGMLNENDGSLMLVGRLFVCQHDGNGNEKSLSQTEIDDVMELFMFGVLWGDY